MKKTYKIQVDCPNCANKMELVAKSIEGVSDATVNFMALRMSIEFAEGSDADRVMDQVRKACRKIHRDCDIFL